MLQDNNTNKEGRQYKNEQIKHKKNPYYVEENNTEPSYQNGYDNYDYNEYPYESIDEKIYNKESSFAGMQRLIIIQVAVCLIIIVFVFAFKAIGGQYYNQFKNWYVDEINKSIIIGDSAENYKSAYALTSQKLKETINSGDAIEVNADANISETNTTTNVNEGELTFMTKLTKPVANAKITSTFNDPEGHNALDLATDANADIVSALSGKILKVDENDTYGKYIIIDHSNGIETLYAHCNEICVTAGQEVTRGAKIATVGSTGNSTGPHVHFELLVDNISYDPLPLIQGDYV